MSEYSLMYPMLALVLLTFGVAVVLFRAGSVGARGPHPGELLPGASRVPRNPNLLAKPTRHFVNLFEVPTLFYAGCLAAMVAGVSGNAVVVLAWGYVVARLVHAFVHMGGNRVRQALRYLLRELDVPARAVGSGCCTALALRRSCASTVMTPAVCGQIRGATNPT